MNRSFRRQIKSIRYAVAILITLIFVLSPVLSLGCGATEWQQKLGSSKNTMLILTGADNGKSIAMQVNDLLIVSLDENPTTGFQWAMDEGSDNVVKLQASEYIRTKDLGVGSRGQRVLTFKAQSIGTARLHLKHWREWEGDKSIIERFTLTLQVRE